MIAKWPRYCELTLAVWLIASGWVIAHSGDYRLLALISGSIIAFLDVLSISLRIRYAHLLILPVCLALAWFAAMHLPHESQGAQNLLTVALLLVILAILPTEATEPPKPWRDFHRRQS
jgi:hypothetical protein